jgi:hypothetical protein
MDDILLLDHYWSFAQDFFTNEDKFWEFFQNYHNEVSGEAPPTGQDLIIESKTIAVCAWEAEFIEPILIQSPNGLSFNRKELLFCLHSTFRPILKDSDYKYFEGLKFLSDDTSDFPGIPTYLMILGS